MTLSNKKSLGRGLEALLGDDDIKLDDAGDIENFVNNTVLKNDNSDEIRVADIFPCPFQPRTEFDEESLESLSESIKEKGVLQPLLLRRKNNHYEIIAGERRWRAAQMAGLNTVPAIIRDLSDQETLEIALVENLQRENLSAIEEAEGLARLQDEYSYTQENLAKVIGKSRSYIANSLRLLSLPQDVCAMVRAGKLSAGHARALVGSNMASELAARIIRDGLSVRQVEHLVADIRSNRSAMKIVRRPDFDMQKIVRDLEKKLNLKVKISSGKNGKGSVTLKYNSPAELSSILDLLEQR